ncbi:hypothetical protein FOL47_001360, partial [Perkinsus chesapeaki]
QARLLAKPHDVTRNGGLQSYIQRACDVVEHEGEATSPGVETFICVIKYNNSITPLKPITFGLENGKATLTRIICDDDKFMGLRGGVLTYEKPGEAGHPTNVADLLKDGMTDIKDQPKGKKCLYATEMLYLAYVTTGGKKGNAFKALHDAICDKIYSFM